MFESKPARNPASTPHSDYSPRSAAGIGLLLALFLVIPTDGGLAQDEPPRETFVEAVDVEIFNLEVYVTDKAGDPVAGLIREDFMLQSHGKPIEIANFYAVEGGQRQPDLDIAGGEVEVPQASSAKPDPLFLLVFIDNQHLSVFSRKRALAFLSEFLDERAIAGDHAMVVSYNGSMKTHQGFTRERKLLQEALEEVDQTAPFGVNREDEYKRVIADMLTLQEYGQSTHVNDPCPAEMRRPADQYARGLYDEIGRTVDHLESFVGSLASLPGRKAILHISDGIPLVPGVEAYEFLHRVCTGAAAADGLSNAQDTTGQITPGSMSARFAQLTALELNTAQLFEDLTDVANANGVTFFPIEAFGPRQLTVGEDPRVPWHHVDFIRVANLQDTLNLMADETGGKAIFNTVNLRPALASIGEDLNTYYSIGFTAPRTEDGKEHQIDVDVTRPGLRVRHRKSFRTKPIAEKLADRTRGALEFGLVDNPLGVALQVGKPLPLDKTLRMVPIRILVPFANLAFLPDTDSRRGKLSVYLAARDRRGWNAPVRSAEVPIELSEARFQEVREKGFIYEIKMLMRPGEHSVAIGVRDEVGATASYLLEEVKIAR